jgi:hypothetical protein
LRSAGSRAANRAEVEPAVGIAGIGYLT